MSYHKLKTNRGFTLVELMITVAISGVVIAAAYQIFATTSEAMYEVDSLSESTNRARFAIETLSRDVESAGAFASPDLDTDPWRNNDHTSLNGAYTMRGLILRTGGQNIAVGPVQQGNNTHWGSVLASSDELIIVGAIDFPFGFEVNRLQPAFPGPVTNMIVPPSSRGLMRFKQRNPFDLSAPALTALNPGETNALIGASAPKDLMGMRVLRLRDRNGYLQFAPLLPGDEPDGNGLKLEMDVNGDVTGHTGFVYRIGGQRTGLEPSSENDIGYEASLVDAYRYRLCVDPEDRRNLRLVRERVDAGVIMNEALPGTAPPATCSTQDPSFQSGGNIARDQIPIADNVVDFQVWVDCVNTTGELIDKEWYAGWIAPDITEAGHNCLTPGGGNPTPGLARMLHIRLAVRTRNERLDLDNYGFVSLTPLTGTGTTFNATSAGSSLQTYDVDGDQTNATRVKTFQIDIDLKNFTFLTAPNAVN